MVVGCAGAAAAAFSSQIWFWIGQTAAIGLVAVFLTRYADERRRSPLAATESAESPASTEIAAPIVDTAAPAESLDEPVGKESSADKIE